MRKKNYRNRKPPRKNFLRNDATSVQSADLQWLTRGWTANSITAIKSTLDVFPRKCFPLKFNLFSSVGEALVGKWRERLRIAFLCCWKETRQWQGKSNASFFMFLNSQSWEIFIHMSWIRSSTISGIVDEKPPAKTYNFQLHSRCSASPCFDD